MTTHDSLDEGGIWNDVTSIEDTATDGTLSMGTGTLSTTYDVYLVTVFAKSHSGTNNNVQIRFNGDSTSNYTWTEVGAASTNSGTGTEALVAQTNNSGTPALDTVAGTLTVICPTDEASAVIFSGPVSSSNQAKKHGVRGSLLKSISGAVDQIDFLSDGNATGTAQVKGRNF